MKRSRAYNLVHRMALAAALLMALRAPARADEPIAAARDLLDSPMWVDPAFAQVTVTKAWHPDLPKLWNQALQRPDAQTRREAVAAYVEAHLDGMPGREATLAKLRGMLEAGEPHPVVRLALARALVLLDDPSSAAVLMRLAGQDGSEMTLQTDLALARWKFELAYSGWIARVGDASAPWQLRHSAMEALGSARVLSARDPLRALAGDRRGDPGTRLVAARALAQIISAGLEDDAQPLLAGNLPDRLVAATMLSTHRGPRPQQMLLTLSDDADPVVQAVAMRRLLEIDPLLLAPLSMKLSASPDAVVRYLASRSLVAQQTAPAVARLAAMLDDHDPTVRNYVRQSLTALGGLPALAEDVRRQAMTVLAGDPWRAQEQASLLLGKLDHKPAWQRLVQLMEPTNRPEVRMASTVALRWLAVPESMPPMLDLGTRMTNVWLKQIDRWRSDPEKARKEMSALQVTTMAAQVAQMMQTFGRMRYQPADELMRRYVPKTIGLDFESRAGAVWGLGLLYENRPDAGLVQQFSERLSDLSPMNPESLAVRRMSAISMGRMRATQAVSILRAFHRSEFNSPEMNGACRWALKLITGEELDPPPPGENVQGGFFLEPLNKADPKTFLR